MLLFLSGLVVLIVAYAYFREGVFTAATMFLNVILAGLVTFNFFEPLANYLDPMFKGSFLHGYEDFLVLVLLFCVSVALLRTITNKLAPAITDFSGYVQQLGGGIFGLLTGYLVAGFLVCALQTLPWHESFLDFQPRGDGEAGLRKMFPPDRAWLALMRHAGAHSLSWKQDREDAESSYDRYLTFDRAGTFELRYLRYRRHGDRREPLKYEGEFDRELQRLK